MKELEKVIGKTIKSITHSEAKVWDERDREDAQIIITFEDGTTLEIKAMADTNEWDDYPEAEFDITVYNK